MARKGKDLQVEVTGSTSEEQEKIQAEVSTSEVQLATLTLDEYLSQVKVNEGLVASFKYEGKNHYLDMLEPKTLDGWAQAFHAQSIREYKP